jgi:hypothetical protein
MSEGDGRGLSRRRFLQSGGAASAALTVSQGGLPAAQAAAPFVRGADCGAGRTS